MRKILSTLFVLAFIALLWISCSKKDVTGTITPAKTGTTGTTLAAGQPTHTIDTTTSSTGGSTGITTSLLPKGMYFSVLINGSPYSLVDKDNGTQIPVNAKFSNNAGQYFEVVSSTFDNDFGRRMVFSLGEIGMPNNNTLPTDAEFTSFFKVKDYNYSIDSYNNATISYIDFDGNVYTSVRTSNPQNSNLFSVLSLKDTTYIYGITTYAAVKMKLKFNCTVADKNGKKLTLTNGQATLLFANY
jgi:hypothetical protein